jgi:hypothetical protein
LSMTIGSRVRLFTAEVCFTAAYIRRNFGEAFPCYQVAVDFFSHNPLHFCPHVMDDLLKLLDIFANANNAFARTGPAYSLELVTTGRKLSFLGDSGLAFSETWHYKGVSLIVQIKYRDYRLSVIAIA